MSLITSPQNPRVKEAVRLRDRRDRERQGRILIDGVRELRRAIEAGVRIAEVFLCDALCTGDQSSQLLETLDRCGGEVLHVAEPVFEKLAFGHRAEGVLGVAETPRPTLESLTLRGTGPFVGEQLHNSPLTPTAWRCPGEGQGVRAPENTDLSPSAQPLVAVLEGVEKPGNVGAVVRSADAAGVSAVIVADARTDLYNPNAIRASLGTIFTMPVCEAASRDVLAWLRQRSFVILAARVDGSVPYTEVDFRGPVAIVLGSEAAGLSSTWTGSDIRAVRVPMLGTADSLNVSATAAVLFYEALRQRGTKRTSG